LSKELMGEGNERHLIDETSGKLLVKLPRNIHSKQRIKSANDDSSSGRDCSH